MYGKTLKFSLTNSWHKRVLRMISDGDLLEITITRTGRNRFKVYAGMDGERIFEMQEFDMKVNDEIRIKDLKTSFDMAR